MYRSLVITVCALLVLGGVLSTGLSGQAGTQEEDLKKRVARLELALKKSSDLVAEQGRALGALDRRLRAIESWVDRVPQVMAALKNSVDASEKAGFAYPAPNAHSKELLLGSLRKLSADLSTPVKASATNK
ncbi:MAG: hypothetical protein HRU14_12045 [Planctomycetes bacterium]|nr:hypothetical protein [Planctomycetota bacterium]